MGIRLLLADDSITIQKVVGIIFANDNYDLTVVDNGTAALDSAREAVPDVMLVDALMPGKNGYEVCQAIRADERLKNVPILLMTGAFEPFDEEKAGQCGADDFISKPFESQQLIEKVSRLFELGSERTAASPAQPQTPPFQEEQLQVSPDLTWEEPVTQPVDSFEPAPCMYDDDQICVEAVIPEEVPLPADQAELSVEVVEAAPGDDPWGVFDLNDLVEITPVEVIEHGDIFGVISEPEPAVSPPESRDEGGEEFDELVEPAPTFDTGGTAARWEPVEEENYSFQAEELTLPADTIGTGEAETGLEAVTEEGNPFLTEEITSPEPFAVGNEEPLAMLSDDIPLEEMYPETSDSYIEPLPDEQVMPTWQELPGQEASSLTAAPADLPVQSAAVAALAAAAATVEPVAPEPVSVQAPFGEEQLRSILSQLSREVIEKIVWEVVPDLAETLIKEEIRKIKEGDVK